MNYDWIPMKHPAAECTKAQREAFERIAINQPARCTQKTLNALMEKKLVEFTSDTRIGRFEIALLHYYVPIPIHAQWCEWCSEQFEKE